jgi:EAL and modified HD-GYP domain-containing signal transduction protein
MSHTVLDSMAMGYQPIWNRARQLSAVRLEVRTLHAEAVDAAHLMQVLGDDWPESAPVLIIAVDSPTMLRQALACEPVQNTWLEVPASQFEDPEKLNRLSLAARKGHKLLRRMQLSALRRAPALQVDVHGLLDLDAEDALAALQSSADAGIPSRTRRAPSPIVPGHIYAGVGSQMLARHCLDESGAMGLMGWPDDDVLHAHRHKPVPCDAAVILQVQKAIAEDSSLDHLERLVRQDPVLVYRILMLVNSAAYGAGREIDSLRHAIMMLGFIALGRWLQDMPKEPQPDPDLHPVRYAMVMRSRLAQHLLEHGSENNLRAEVYTTALFAQLDRLMHQPLAELLSKLPLSGRVYEAALRHDGPYHPLLEVARVQGEPGELQRLSTVCHQHGLSLEHANRSLIRMLATSRDHDRPRPGRLH